MATEQGFFFSEINFYIFHFQGSKTLQEMHIIRIRVSAHWFDKYLSSGNHTFSMRKGSGTFPKEL